MNNNLEKEIMNIYIDDIIPNRFQPRLSFDEKSLQELSDSIRQHGIIQPLVVRRLGDKYEIIAGERRYKASQMAGLSKVPAIVMNVDDQESAEVAVVENIQRRDLTALEEAESYKKLLDKGYLTQEQLASRMGKNQATISNKLRLLTLPKDIKDSLLNEKISERHARSLLSLKTEADQINVLNQILTQKLTVKQTDELIKNMINPSVTPVVSNNVETLDFNSVKNVLPTDFDETSPVITIEEPIPTVISPVEEVKNNISTPSVINDSIVSIEDAIPSTFVPISNIDINKIKEQSFDLNKEEPIKNVDNILGVESKIPSSDIEIKPSGNRFIQPIYEEDDEAEKPKPIEPTQTTFGSIPSLISVAPLSPEPKTFTDSLVQEFRQSNTVSAESNAIVPGDLKSAIGAVRDLNQLLEKNNFKIQVEEFDFEKLYQIIIKINK